MCCLTTFSRLGKNKNKKEEEGRRRLSVLSDPMICQRHSANKGFTIWVSESVHERYNITLTVISCRYQRSQQFCIQLKVYNCLTLRASLSGTFLQTLPDLVTPLKAALGTLYLRAAVHRRGQRPPKGLGTDKTVEAT